MIADVSNGLIRGHLTARRPLPVYPDKRHSQSPSAGLKRAQEETSADLFDHLVGAGE